KNIKKKQNQKKKQKKKKPKQKKKRCLIKINKTKKTKRHHTISFKIYPPDPILKSLKGKEKNA
ncbi:hypothetical protein, partial [Pectobacterium brasiliense]|uniref:hypothetical protein n=1 Tax=Pectobacterium brasiliense TaxID=180957 RepID=UPI001969FDAF